MANFDYPDRAPLVDTDRTVTVQWNQWFQRLQTIAETVSASGTTANRPTRLLFVGRQYFDTTLGKPVYVKAVNPAVWVDATGAAV